MAGASTPHLPFSPLTLGHALLSHGAESASSQHWQFSFLSSNFHSHWIKRKRLYSLQNSPLGLKLGPGDLREHLPLGHLAVSWPSYKRLIFGQRFIFSLVYVPLCIPNIGRSSRFQGPHPAPRVGIYRASRAADQGQWAPPKNIPLYFPIN